MTKAKQVKIDQLSPEHYTVYDALKALAKSGFLVVIITVIFTGGILYWKVETLGKKNDEQDVKLQSQDTALANHRTILYARLQHIPTTARSSTDVALDFIK